MEPDFSGYATKVGLECSDGRTIMPDAFKHMHGQTVPLVWAHGHNSVENVLGHAVLEACEDGVRAHGFFNETPMGQHAKKIVQHKDVRMLSIYANKLQERAKQVYHGFIREVSLVLNGANPGAHIDFVNIRHDDGELERIDDEAVIKTGLLIHTADDYDDYDDEDGDDLAHAGRTMKDVYESMTQEQKDFLHFAVGAVSEATGDELAQSDIDPDDTDDQSDANEGDLNHQEGNNEMRRNVFENNEGSTPSATGTARRVLSHSDVKSIVDSASRSGSLKHAVQEYALAHGITDIDTLFPDAKTLTDRPEFNKRRTEWVDGVLNGVGRSPFARVKTITADITQDDARAKGYIKGEYKKEEWFGVTKRTTGPTTVYKKQKLDRDDIIDITDFDVVAWMKWEIRLMLEEEIAGAILIGDGREVDDEDKIKNPMAATSGDGIRAIADEHELFATTVNVNLADASSDYHEVIDALARARRHYKGTGMPTLYTTETHLTEMLLLRDNDNKRMYRTVAELAAELRVRDVVPVEIMDRRPDIFGIIVNLSDYNVGTDRGGEINMFDDFDIDYNQFKYLMETRLSGALTKIKSALIIKLMAGTDALVTPTDPTFVASTGVVTIPTKTGVVYKNKATNATLTAGAQTALAAGESITVLATPAPGYYLDNNAEDEWYFKRPAA